MSTIVPPPPTFPPGGPGWIPVPLCRITVEQYEAMVESGAFKASDRFHLINEYLVAKISSTWLVARSRSTATRGRRVTGRAWISRRDRWSPS